MNDLLFVLTAVAAVLALVAGAIKALRPHNTAIAFEAVTGWPVTEPAVRAGSAIEVAVALAALAGTRLGAAALSLSYLAFTGFVLTALGRGKPVSSCGCFGEPDVPPSIGHVAFDAVAAAAAGLSASMDTPSLGQAMSGQPLIGVPLILLVLITAGLAYLLLAVVPKRAAIRAAGSGRQRRSVDR